MKNHKLFRICALRLQSTVIKNLTNQEHVHLKDKTRLRQDLWYERLWNVRGDVPLSMEQTRMRRDPQGETKTYKCMKYT